MGLRLKITLTRLTRCSGNSDAGGNQYIVSTIKIPTGFVRPQRFDQLMGKIQELR